MSGDWERRDQALNRIREGLKQALAKLELANQYWVAPAGDRGEDDYRSGQNVTEAYREAALKSTEGAVAFARAYREPITVSGEPPRSKGEKAGSAWLQGKTTRFPSARGPKAV